MNSQRTRQLAHNLFKLKANKNLSIEREVGAESPPHWRTMSVSSSRNKWYNPAKSMMTQLRTHIQEYICSTETRHETKGQGNRETERVRKDKIGCVYKRVGLGRVRKGGGYD